ncbi:MAG: TRAP transporter substrate-binding protein DctP [Synergistaceae bacterium]|nr:TRAP transporter substrate-binding protein DctP [Synergistaceae bacterium]
MLKKVFSIVALCMMVFCFSSCAYAKDVTFKLSHHRPVDSQLDIDMKQFAQDVAKATSNRVKIQVFPAGQLGGSESAMERVSMGAIDMMVGYPNSELDPKLDIYSLPGIAKDFKDLKKLFHRGSPYMNVLEKIFNDSDMHVLGSYCTAFVGICFKDMPVNPKDPNAKHNEKIRVPSINAYRYVAEAIGYMGTPLPWGEVFTALQTGVVDGVYGPAAEPVYTTLRDVVKVYVPLNSQADMFFLLINQEKFDLLSQEDQKLLSEIGHKLEQSRFEKAEAEQEMWEKRLADKGIEVMPFSNEELLSFQKKIQEYSWPKLSDEMGSKFFDETIAAWKEAMK